MAIWIIAAIAAFYIKGLCGFANTLVFDSILSFSANNISISPVELLTGYPSNGIMAFRERKHINVKLCLKTIVLLIIGSIPGTLFLANASDKIVKIVLGFVIVILGIEMLYKEIKGTTGDRPKWFLAMLGLIGGIMCGLYGIGVLVGVFMNYKTSDTHEFKANMATVFFAENTIRIINYSLLGIITIDILKQSLFLIPAMLVGLFLGMKSADFLNEKVAKKIVIVMLIISGVALILNNVM